MCTTFWSAHWWYRSLAVNTRYVRTLRTQIRSQRRPKPEPVSSGSNQGDVVGTIFLSILPSLIKFSLCIRALNPLSWPINRSLSMLRLSPASFSINQTFSAPSFQFDIPWLPFSNLEYHNPAFFLPLFHLWSSPAQASLPAFWVSQPFIPWSLPILFCQSSKMFAQTANFLVCLYYPKTDQPNAIHIMNGFLVPQEMLWQFTSGMPHLTSISAVASCILAKIPPLR